MNKKSFFGSCRRNVLSLFTKGFGMMNDAGKRLSLQINIHHLRNHQKEIKVRIGDYVINHKKEFIGDEYISSLLARIEGYQERIALLEEKITKIKK